MQLLLPSEYDASYFDGAAQTLKHNAGYSSYARWYRSTGVNSLGEHYKDIAKAIFDKYTLQGKKVLEIGCAKGFLVKDLRDFGADAYGIDVSQYAIDNAEAGMSPYLTVADARTYLKNYKDKEFDFIFSLRFFECLSDVELDALVPELNRISNSQYHRFGDDENASFYANRDEAAVSAKGFQEGTDLSAGKGDNSVATK